MTLPSTRLTLIPPTGMRGDLLKAMYAVMLAELPRAAVRAFWTAHPFRANTRLVEPLEFLDFLWRGLLEIPPEYFWPVVRDLEGCARANGLDPERFFHLVNHGPQGGPPVDPDWAGELLFPSPLPGHPIADPRDWILQRLEAFLSGLLIGCPVRRVPEPGGGPSGSALFAFHPPAEAARLPDFNLFPGKLVAAVPRLFGWQAFDSLELLASAGDAGDGAVPSAGRAGAKQEPFGAALERLVGPEVAALFPEALLAAPVRVLRRDWMAEDGKRRILRRGRVFGAPFALLRVGYVPRLKWRRLAARLLAPEPRRPQPAPGAAAGEMLDTLHREFLAEWEKSRINH